MKSTFVLMRVWAMLTGIALAVWYFAELAFGSGQTDTLPMLVTAIGGFELFHFLQDLWLNRGRTNG